MAAFEWVVVTYFAALTVAAWFLPVSPARRLHVTALGAGMSALALLVAVTAGPTLRAWVPHVYLVAGYWMPALLVPARRGRRFEDWLQRSDDVVRRLLPGVPARLGPFVELAYLLCYPLVPLSFAVVWLNGSGAAAERFWLAVLLAGYSCYVTLPWLVSRPPRLLIAPTPASRGSLAGMNALVLGRVSHQLNTFPSGHVAVAAAAAASVATISAPAGVLLGLGVAAICVGAAAGRYHYVVDVVMGLAVAVMAFLTAAGV
jgi:hypothetical protein